MTKTAVISGVGGQDSSYLCRYLLSLGYTVFGFDRRKSNHGNLWRLRQLGVIDNPKLNIIYGGDITDPSFLIKLLYDVGPDQFYHLAAQSFVSQSWRTPYATMNTNVMGTLVCLQAVLSYNLNSRSNCRFYFAGSSEQFGNIEQWPQNQQTKFYPRSPYGVSKVAGFNLVKNYRESYRHYQRDTYKEGCDPCFYAVSGILFNHECVIESTPIIYKIGNTGEVDIKPIIQVVNLLAQNKQIDHVTKTIIPDKSVYVWDNNKWSKIIAGSAFKNDVEKQNKKPRYIVSKNSCVCATSDHICIMQDGTEKPFGNVKIKDNVAHGTIPTSECNNNTHVGSIKITNQLAQLIGFIVAQGYIRPSGCGTRIVGTNLQQLEYYNNIWERFSATQSRYAVYPGQFKPTSKIHRYNFRVGRNTKVSNYQRNKQLLRSLRSETYTWNGKKRVPQFIINAREDIVKSFLSGYFSGDGLKPKSINVDYQWPGFTTNSQVLAAGIIYLMKKWTNQDFNICPQQRLVNGKLRIYYHVNLLTDKLSGQQKAIIVNKLLDKEMKLRPIARQTGFSRKFVQQVNRGHGGSSSHFMLKSSKSVKKIIQHHQYQGYLCDLATESGTFSAGIGLAHIHNSPIRGKEFVTRKITDGVARIYWQLKNGEKVTPIQLGNLYAKRDWGHSADFVRAIHLMLNQKDDCDPKDYVISSGEAHSVKEFVNTAFAVADIEIYDVITSSNATDEKIYDKNGNILVKINPKFYRPAQVNHLLGDSTLAREQLGWEPAYTFNMLVEQMVLTDIQRRKNDYV